MRSTIKGVRSSTSHSISSIGASLLVHAPLVLWFGAINMTPPSAAPMEQSVASIDLAPSSSQAEAEVVFETSELEIQQPKSQPIKFEEQRASATKPPTSKADKTPLSKRPSVTPFDHSQVDAALIESVVAELASELREHYRQVAEIHKEVVESTQVKAENVDSSPDETSSQSSHVTVAEPADKKQKPLESSSPKAPSEKQVAQREKTDAPKPRPEAKSSSASVASQANVGTKVDQLPQKLPNNHPPAYPREQWSNGVEGRVILRVRVGSNGNVDRVNIHRTSGVKAFDTAAIKAVKTWRFNPARRGDDAVAYEIAVPIRFRIKG